MKTRRNTVVALATVAALTTGTAAIAIAGPQFIGDDSSATESVELVGSPFEQYGMTFTLPEDYAAFTLADGELSSHGAEVELPAETLAVIEEELKVADAQSIVFVDTTTIYEDGLTTALATVIPTEEVKLGRSNAQMQSWLGSLFPEQEGTMDSLKVKQVPNANLSYVVADEDLSWQVTEYIFQYGNAAMSVRFTSVDDSGTDKDLFDQMMIATTR